MKFYTKTALFALAILTIVSCSKDDPTPNIIGRWTVQSSTLNLQVSGKSLYDYLVSGGIATSQAQQIVDSFTDGFNADGAGVIFEFKSGGTYTEQNGPSDKNPTTGTWTLNKKSISLTDDTNVNYKPTGTVTNATDTDLSIDLLVKSDNSSGFQVDYVVTIVFKKSQ